MPTIYDVARKAGVSPKTVSRVLNQEPNVRQTTLEAVERAIEYLDYRPSTAARLLKSQRTRVVGFLTDRVVTSPEANAIARGVSEAARAAGYTVIFLNELSSDAPLTGQAFNQLVDLKVDGIIYASHLLRQIDVTGYADHNKPLVLANCFSGEGAFTAIIPDDKRGGQLAAEMIIAHGHRRVTMLNLDEASFAAGDRWIGFSQGFSVAGLAAPTMVTSIFEDAGSWDEHRHLPKILDEVLAAPEPPTVLFCGNDKLAMVVYGLLAQRGVRVPDDISVVGYDDFPHICQLLRPRLSSVSIAHDLIGQRAFDELYRQLNDLPGIDKAAPALIKVEGAPFARASLADLKTARGQSGVGP